MLLPSLAVLTGTFSDLRKKLTAANQALRELNRFDGLTGAKNRAYFNERYEVEWRHAQRTRDSLGMLMIDIDHFKRINDTYGHVAGDACLTRVAAIIGDTARRSTDDAFRYGGEEFAVLLTATDTIGAAHIAEIIRFRIETAEMNFNGSKNCYHGQHRRRRADSRGRQCDRPAHCQCRQRTVPVQGKRTKPRQRFPPIRGRIRQLRLPMAHLQDYSRGPGRDMEKSQADFTRRYADGRLRTRPLAPTIAPDLDAGRYLLTFDNGLQAQIHVPPDYQRGRPLPLLAIFHGAHGLDGGAVGLASAWAKRHGALLIAQKSHAASWDLLRGAWGVDLAFTDFLLAWSMQRYAIDAARIGIAGFSDGASYALSVGLGNGDLFSDILAFSPGFMRPAKRVGRPRIYVAHGMPSKTASTSSTGTSGCRNSGTCQAK